MAFKPVPIEITEHATNYFWQRVDQSPHPKGCWIWTGSQSGMHKDKYGRMGVGKHRPGAHRYSYALHNGPVPDGLEVCHECDNTLCVNPAHLWLGTHQQNLKDCADKGRIVNRAKPGERNHVAKLTEVQVYDIRNALKNGVRVGELARLYQVSTTTIVYIRQRKNWAYLPEK